MKKWMVGGTILVIVGLLLCSVGFALSGGDLQKASGNSDFERKEATYAPDGLTKVKIEERDADITLGVSTDDKIHITYYENAKNRYEITQGDAWKIVKKTAQNWTDEIMNFNFAVEGNPLTILLPEGIQWDVELNSALGDVTVTGGAYAGLSLETDYGVMDLSNVTASYLDISSSKGDLFLEDIHVDGRAEADSQYGMLQLTQVETVGPLEAETDNGDITLENVKALSVAVGSDYGEISLRNVAAEGSLEAKTDKGDLDLDQVSAGSGLTLKTDYGSISGSLLGKMSDYSIEASTDLGDSNLPPVFREGRINLYVHTDLGDINVTFQEKFERR